MRGDAGNRPVRILFLTSHSPEGPEQGARLRARHILRQLSRFAEVRLILAGSYEDYTGATDVVPNPSRPCGIMEFHDWKIEGAGDRIRYELGSTYLNTHGHRASEEDRHRLLELIDAHDLVWVHGLRVANGFDLWKWPKTILDIDDIPSDVSKSVMIHAMGFAARLRAFRKFRMWKRHEARLFERFGAVAVCSGPDRARLGNREDVFIVPNGFEAPTSAPMRMPTDPARIGFIGSLEYPPNANGLRWFLRDVWPVILLGNPDTTLRLIGKFSDAPEWTSAPNTEGLGWVADADGEMATWAMTIVPIFEGGGTRVKISNAFSRKCPIVSTALGAYGYETENGRELLLAETAPDFASACARIINEPDLAERLADKAWKIFLEKWTWDANAPRLETAIRFLHEKESTPLPKL